MPLSPDSPRLRGTGSGMSDFAAGIRRARLKPAAIVALLTLVVFLTQLGLTLNEIPSFSLIEEYVCSKQHGGADPSILTRAECQTVLVNREANKVQMLSMVTTTVPAILTAWFYGSMMDNWGRRRTMQLSLAGIFIFQALSLGLMAAVPRIQVEAVSAAGVALFAGGGVGVAEAAVFTILSDISSPRWRTVYFQIVVCSVLVAELVGAVASPFLMRQSAQSPLYVGLAFNAGGWALLLLVPETLAWRRPGTVTPQADRESPPPPPPRRWRPVATSSRRIWTSARAAGRLLRDRRLALLVPAAALTLPLATASASLLSRIAPLRYDASFATASALVAVRAAANVAVLLVGQPLLLGCWRGGSAFRRDRRLAGVFAAPLCAGMLVVAASPSPAQTAAGLVVFTLGAAVPGLVRALLVQMVDPTHLGSFFGLLAVVEQTGFLTLGLLLAGLFDAALGGGGGPARLGLPLYVSGGLFAVFALCLWLARPVPREEEEEGDGQEEEEDQEEAEFPQTHRSSTHLQEPEGRTV